MDLLRTMTFPQRILARGEELDGEAVAAVSLQNNKQLSVSSFAELSFLRRLDVELFQLALCRGASSSPDLPLALLRPASWAGANSVDRAAAAWDRSNPPYHQPCPASD